MKKVSRLRTITSEESAMDRDMMATSETISVRTTGRIKKPKAVFDPSDNYLPRALRPAEKTPNTSANTSPQGKRDIDAMSLSPSSVDDSDFGDVCEICAKREAKRGIHSKNKLLTCPKCKKCVHKLCLPQEFEDFSMLRRFYQCEDCRKCSVCNEPHRTKNDLVTCTKCIKTYHFSCHSTSVKSRTLNALRSWKCYKCTTVTTSAPTSSNNAATTTAAISVERKEKVIKELRSVPSPGSSIMSSTSKTTTLVPLSRKSATLPTSNNNINNNNDINTTTQANGKRSLDYDKIDNGKVTPLTNTTTFGIGAVRTMANEMKKDKPIVYKEYSIFENIDLPDVKNFSVAQVAEFMGTYFPKDAQVFIDHEIDGECLLLMKRSDVVKKLSMKLGPALRIYSLILKLQTQSNDPTLGWNCDA